MTAALDYMAELRVARPMRMACAALVVVDMQRASASREDGLGRLVRERGDADRLAWRFDRIERVVVPNLLRLLNEFRRRGLHVFHVTLGSAEPGFADIAPHLRSFTSWVGNSVGSPVNEILPELLPAPGEVRLRKTTMGALASTDLERRLRDAGLTDIVVAGVSTSFCIDQTARELADRGFSVTIVEDGVAENVPDWHSTTLELFARSYGRVLSTSDVLADLCREAATAR